MRNPAKYRPARHWLIYVALRFLGMICLMFPIHWNLRKARFMGRVWYRFIARHRERARDHLRSAYGSQLSARQIDHIARESMQQLAMMAVESLFLPRLISERTWPQYVKLNGIERAIDTLLSRRGAILVTGHFGSWELLGFVMAALGFPLVAVMRPLDNPYLNQYLMRVRVRRGLRLLYKKGAAAVAGDILRSGGLLGFIGDQNAGHKGIFVDFFGRKASAYKSIALLAIEYRVPVIAGYARRIGSGFQYEVGCNMVLDPAEWAGRDDEVRWITEQYTRAIEAFVREAPGQYLWIHRRWKSRPPEEPRPGHTTPRDGCPAVDGPRRDT